MTVFPLPSFGDFNLVVPTLGQFVAEDIGLDVDQHETVHLFKLFGLHDQNVDSQGVDEGPVFRSLDFAEGDQGSRGPFPTQDGSQRVSGRNAIGVRVGLQEDSDPVTPIEKRAEIFDPQEVGDGSSDPTAESRKARDRLSMRSSFTAKLRHSRHSKPDIASRRSASIRGVLRSFAHTGAAPLFPELHKASVCSCCTKLKRQNNNVATAPDFGLRTQSLVAIGSSNI